MKGMLAVDQVRLLSASDAVELEGEITQGLKPELFSSDIGTTEVLP